LWWNTLRYSTLRPLPDTLSGLVRVISTRIVDYGFLDRMWFFNQKE
jgi:hypothetical protein